MVKVKELEEKVSSIINNYKKCPWRKTEVKIVKYKPIYAYKTDATDYGIAVIVSQMYDFVELKFPMLNELSDLFQTDHINVGERNQIDGCESCDFGSSYTIKFNIKSFKLDIEDL